MSETDQSSIIYLACPYTHNDPQVRKQRFEAATHAAAYLIEIGYVVYSPITMTHPIDLVLAEDGATLGSDYWVTFDRLFMDACSEIFVLQISGWDESRGVRSEIDYFSKQGKKISFMQLPDDPSKNEGYLITKSTENLIND